MQTPRGQPSEFNLHQTVIGYDVHITRNDVWNDHWAVYYAVVNCLPVDVYMGKGNPAVAGSLTLLDYPFDAGVAVTTYSR